MKIVLYNDYQQGLRFNPLPTTPKTSYYPVNSANPLKQLSQRGVIGTL